MLKTTIMKRLFLVFCGSLLLWISGCKREQAADQLPSFRMENFERVTDPCDEAGNNCVRMRAVFPVFESGMPAPVQERVNDSILQLTKASLTLLDSEFDLHEFTLDMLADTLFQTYATYTGEAEYRTPWELEVKGEVLFLSPSMTTVSLESFSFTGGAHPNSNTVLLNIDLKTGKSVNLLDYVQDLKKLNQLAEKAFRESRELAPEEDLNEAGFFWDSDFQLPANIGLVEEGLYFYYNSYEIAAYAWGSTDFVLTWETLGEIFDRNRVE